MIVRAVTVWVNSDSIPAFEEATAANQRASILEPGVLRFDVLRSTERPGEYLLYEAYANPEAAEDHKNTAHYKLWRDAVAPFMDRPREGRSFSVVAPTSPESWEKKQTPAR